VKGIHLSSLLFVVAACSATARQDSTEPPPTPSDPAPAGDPSGTTTATPPPTGSQPTPPARPRTVCPSLQIKAPDAVSAGQVARVTLVVTDPGGTPTYNWTVSAGGIESGQGTTAITVGTRGLDGGSVTATVELGGLPVECTTRTAIATFLVGA